MKKKIRDNFVPVAKTYHKMYEEIVGFTKLTKNKSDSTLFKKENSDEYGSYIQ